MTPAQFKKFCENSISGGAIDMTRPSHYEELSPLLESHAEEVTVTKAEFHGLSGNVYYPRKETTDRIGNAAGISFTGDVMLRNTDKEAGEWTGTAFPQELGPDGKMMTWAPATYVFNSHDRAEEELLRQSVKNNAAPPTETALKLKTLEYKKVAPRRADTGARVAAIISALGMPTGFKDLFLPSEPPTSSRTFLFSRIIVNTKNELVMRHALDHMFSVAPLLGGMKQPTTALLGTSTDHHEEPTIQGEADAMDDEFEEDEENDTREAYLEAARVLFNRHRGSILPKATAIFEAELAIPTPPTVDLARAQFLLLKIKELLTAAGVRV